MASVRWTVGARKDLREVVEYIGQDSVVYAADTIERIFIAIEKLRTFPNLGRVVLEYDDDTIRELIVGSYRVVYRLRQKRVNILAIVHSSRDLLRQLGAEPWHFR